MATFSSGIGSFPNAPLFARHDIDDTLVVGTAPNKQITHFRSPKLYTMASGRILAVAEAFASQGSDQRAPAIYLRYSDDSGLTWSKWKEILRLATFVAGSDYINEPCLVQTPDASKMVMIVTRNVLDAVTYAQIYYSTSTDGITWTASATVFASNEITQYVTKGSAAGGIPKDVSGRNIPLCYDGTNNARWKFQAISSNGVANANGIFFSGYHRYTADTSGTCWAHSILGTSSDGWATIAWQLAGGLDEATAANNNTNETSTVKCDNGDLFSVGRIENGPGYTLYKWYSRTSDGATGMATWATASVADGGGGRLLLPSIGTHQGMAVSATSGNIFLAYTGEQIARSGLQITQLTNNANTQGDTRVLQYNHSAAGSCGYPDICVDSTGTGLVVAYETTHYGDGSSYTSAIPQEIAIRRVSTSWVNDYASGTTVCDLPFGEATAGAIATAGNQVIDQGGMDHRPLGGTGGTFTATGIRADGTNIALYLCKPMTSSNGTIPTVGSIWDIGADTAWTLEIIGLNVATWANNKAVAASGAPVSGTTHPGWRLTTQIAATKLQFRACDNSSHTVNLTSNFALVNGTEYNVRVTLSGGFWNMYISSAGTSAGDLETLTPVANTLVTSPLTINQVNGEKLSSTVWGCDAAAAIPMGSTIDVKRLRVTRGKALTSGLLNGTETKTSPATYQGRAIISAPSTGPTSIATCKLWLGGDWDGGRARATDYFAGYDVPEMAPQSGRGISAVFDHAQAKLFKVAAEGRACWSVSDGVLGSMIRNGLVPAGAPSCLVRPAANTDYDFVTTTGNFSIALSFILKSDLGALQTLFDNSSGNGDSGVGFCLGISATRTVWLKLIGSVFTYATASFPSGPTFTVGSRYFLGVTGTAATGDVKLYWLTYPLARGSSASTFSTATAAAGLSGGHADNVSTGAPTIGGKVDVTSNPADVQFKNFCIWNTPLTAAQMFGQASFSAGPPKSSRVGLNLGLRLGL